MIKLEWMMISKMINLTTNNIFLKNLLQVFREEMKTIHT